MPAPTVLPGRAFQSTDRTSNLLFHFRAADLLLKTMGGASATFSRAGAPGRVVQKGLRRTDLSTDADLIRLSDDGTAQTPSWGYFLRSDTGLYVPALVLGRAYTNLISSDNLAAWAGTATVTATIGDPLGGTGAYTVADTSAAASQDKYLLVPFTGNGVKSIIWVVRERTMSADFQRLRVWDDGASAIRLQLDITAWVAGVPTVAASAGTYLGKRYVGSGYWQIFAQTTSVTAANNNYVYLLPATTASVGSFDTYRVNAYNDPVPSPANLSASIVRAADSLTFPYNGVPQAATYLYEGFVCDLPNMGTDRYIFNVGNATGNDAHLAAFYDDATARLYITYANGTTEVTAYWTSTIVLGDHIQIRVPQAASGAITPGLTINGGAEDTTLDGAFASTVALPSAWNSQAVSFSPGANQGLVSFKAIAGSTHSLPQCQEAF